MILLAISLGAVAMRLVGAVEHYTLGLTETMGRIAGFGAGMARMRFSDWKPALARTFGVV